ncbi:methyltransferase domain-containing protein [Auraticoccus sp. F435]|uniref:Methyltransferase domain-containing protein n=1 Tax=Auraticoccus cholistanensis TaxID=2656650 RepID=A0A6A9UTU2_9ACTN|nr:class I SAM-dependent methyltransferase [Auraticoccus cholistanensis]MVA76356.1 methyltransferase domain-containing protein [Auraticoccus cholistanensis]
MDPALVERLTAPEGRSALELAAAQRDPSSPAAVTTLRRSVDAELSSAALQQETLRRRAAAKFGAAAAGLLLTPDGLEQASRPEVADHRARRLAATGARAVVDLGCGIGADALAFVRAGLRVVAVERDPGTAAVARANLAGLAEVVEAAAEDVTHLLGPGVAAYCDPARRDARGRLWDVSQFSPGWDLVRSLLSRAEPAAVKLGPALPHAMLPEEVEAEWVTHRGDTVEVCLWSGPGVEPGTRTATLLPGGDRLRVGAGERSRRAPVGPIGSYLLEPAGSVIRAGGVAVLAEQLGAHLVDPQIAYLTTSTPPDSSFVDVFRVREVLPWREKTVRAWLQQHRVGRLEIKKRGLDLDPAVLRRRLKPSGPEAATLLLTRTPQGARAVLADRVAEPPAPVAAP